MMEIPRRQSAKRLTCFFVFLCFLSSMLATRVLAENEDPSQENSVKMIEDFSSSKNGKFPRGWKSRGGHGKKVYKVVSDQENHLEATAIDNAIAIGKKVTYNVDEFPFLSWQWRAIELPEGADERYKKTGDSAAAIYVIFPDRFKPRVIKYVWSTSLPIGTTTKSPYDGKTKVVVIQNQCSPLGTWLSEKVNIYEDFKRLFGKEPKSIEGIGLMSDSDNTHSRAVAHYKKITASRE